MYTPIPLGFLIALRTTIWFHQFTTISHYWFSLELISLSLSLIALSFIVLVQRNVKDGFFIDMLVNTDSCIPQ